MKLPNRLLLLFFLLPVAVSLYADDRANNSRFERDNHADIAAIDKSFNDLDANNSGGIDINEAKASHALQHDFSELQQYGDIDIKVYRQWLISKGDLGLKGEDWHR